VLVLLITMTAGACSQWPAASAAGGEAKGCGY